VDGHGPVLAESTDPLEVPAGGQNLVLDVPRCPVDSVRDRRAILPLDAIESSVLGPGHPPTYRREAHAERPGHGPEGLAALHGFYHRSTPSLTRVFLAMPLPPVSAVYSEYSEIEVVAHE
jgi:hypothetical protein